MHQLGVVQHSLGIQHVEVLLEELPGAHPLRAVRGLTRGDHVRRIHPQLAGPGQHGPDLSRERPGRKGPGQRVRPVGAAGLDAALQGLADPELLLRAGQQPDRGRERVGVRPDLVGEPADQRVPEGMEGHGQRGDRGTPEPAGDPGPQVGGGLAGEGEHQDAVRGDAAGVRSGPPPTPRGWSSCRCPVRPAPAAGRRDGPRRPAGRRPGPVRRAAAPGCGSGGTWWRVLPGR